MSKRIALSVDPAKHMCISLGEPCHITRIEHKLKHNATVIEFVRFGEKIERIIPCHDMIPVVTHEEYILGDVHE